MPKTVFRSRYPSYQWRGCTFHDGRFETDNPELVRQMTADPYCGEGNDFWVEALPAGVEQAKDQSNDADAEAAEKAKTSGKTSGKTGR
jgi:hypothetical protein